MCIRDRPCTAAHTGNCNGLLRERTIVNCACCVKCVLMMPMNIQQYLTLVVTKRRSSWACTGNPKPEQETIEGTHAQETPAYHTARGAGQPHCTWCKEATQAPNQGATHAASEYIHTHIKPHRVPPVQQAQTSTVPTAGATGSIPAHTQLKTRRRGNSPAPKNTARH